MLKDIAESYGVFGLLSPYIVVTGLMVLIVAVTAIGRDSGTKR